MQAATPDCFASHRCRTARHAVEQTSEAGGQFAPALGNNPQPLENRSQVRRNRARLASHGLPARPVEQFQVILHAHRQKALVAGTRRENARLRAGRPLFLQFQGRQPVAGAVATCVPPRLLPTCSLVGFEADRYRRRAERCAGWSPERPSEQHRPADARLAGSVLSTTYKTGGGQLIEIQCKEGLTKGDDFWTATDRLIQGLNNTPSLRGALVVSRASQTIQMHLKDDIRRLADGRDDGLRPVTLELLERQRALGLTDTAIFRRFRIIKKNVKEGDDGRTAATALLRYVLQNPSATATAWSKLVDEGHDLIARRGRKTVESLLGLLSRHVDLASTSNNLLVARERYTCWVAESNSAFDVPGLGVSLPITSAWMRLRVMDDEHDRRPSKAGLARQIEAYHEWERFSDGSVHSSAMEAQYLCEFRSRVAVIGGPGSGKSTLARLLAHSLASSGRLVLKVRLALVSQLMARGEPFDSALLTAASDRCGIPEALVRDCLAQPDCLIADGLDECDPRRGMVADGLRSWAWGHPDCRICVTTRPVGHEPALLPGFEHVELLPLDQRAIQDHSKRLFEAALCDARIAGECWVNFILATDDDKTPRTVASLAARNPLLLGFVARLTLDGVALGKSRAELYRQIIDLTCASAPSDRDGPADVEREIVDRVADIVGWCSVDSPGQDLSQTVSFVADELALQFRLSRGEAGLVTSKGVKFLESRRLIERLTAGHLETVVFTHMSLGEFAAARHVTRFDDGHFREWLRRVRRNPRWRQVILLVAGQGQHIRLLDELLTLDCPDDPGSTEACLAAVAAEEVVGIEANLLGKIGSALQKRITSEIPLVSVESSLALLSLAKAAPLCVSDIDVGLVSHPQEWTRLGALALKLAANCSPETLNVFTEWFRESPSSTLDFRGGLGFPESIRTRDELRELEHAIVEVGAGRLVERCAPEDVATFFDGFPNVRKLTLANFEVVESALKRAGYNEIAQRFARRFNQPYQMGKTWISPLHSGLKRAKEGTLVFLECLRAVTGNSTQDARDERALPYLGISAIFESLDMWRSHVWPFSALAERQSLDVVQEVLRGVVIALRLDRAELCEESLGAAKHIAGSNTLSTLFDILTHVSVDPKWHLARDSGLDSRKIGAGLLHPCDGIALASANLAKAGVTGDGGPELLQVAMERGGDNTLFLVSKLAEPIWGPAATEFIMKRLDGPLTSGCEHLLKTLAGLGKPSDKDLIVARLLSALEYDDPKIAVGAAKAFDKLPQPLEKDAIARLRKAYDHWTRRGTRCDRHNIVVRGSSCPECNTVPPSPREQLLSFLASNSHWSVEELLEMEQDERHDVAGAARKAIAGMAERDRYLLGSLLQQCERGEARIDLLRELLKLPCEALKSVVNDILRLLDTENPKVRLVVLSHLPADWISQIEVRRVATTRMRDADPSVRTQAVRTLRLLEESSAANIPEP
jgi:hypothetical protein